MKGGWFPVILFVLIVVLIALDLAEDMEAGTTVFHLVIELLMMLAAVVGAFYFWNQLRVSRQAKRDLERELKKARAETNRWQKEERDLLNNLRKAIDKQFTQWGFSPTYKEVAFYLLKGLSLKEIAELRGSTFQSVRQQSHMLYHQAGLKSRAELSAFFLGGLLQPDVAPDEAGDEPLNQQP
jgi:DNA-binding CsgD family transcriptional regulator